MSFSEAECESSLRRRDFSVKVPRQYLKTVMSEIGLPLHEFVASLPSESDDVLYVRSRVSCLTSGVKFLKFDLPS